MIARMLAGAAGIVMVSQFPVLPGKLVLALILASGIILNCIPPQWLRLAGCCMLGIFWGCLRGHEALARMLPPGLEGRDLDVQLCIEGLPQWRSGPRGEQWRLRARVLHPLPGAHGALAYWQGRRIEFSWYGEGDFAPGDIREMRLRLKTPRGFVNPGGFDYQAWLLGQGIDATGYAVGKGRHARLAMAACGSPSDHWRHWLRERLQQRFPDEPQLGRLLAVTIGDASLFSPADWELFARTGTTHLMVISGMHITLVALLVIGAANRLVRRVPLALLRFPARSWGVVAALPAALVYGLLAGMGVSVQRALLMVLVAFAYLIRERSIQPWLAYASALLAVLVVQPLATLQGGFWLSFITVGALLLAYGGRLGQPPRIELLWRPQIVVAVALLAPLALLGQPQAPFAPLVNALAIPLTDVIIVPAALLGCLLLPAGDVLAWVPLKIAFLGLELLDGMLRLAARYSPPVPAIAPAGDAWRIALAACGTAWLLLPRVFGARLAGIVLLLPLLAPVRDRPPLLELTMLDVGQGTALLVRTAGHALVYDTGPRYSERFDAGSAIVAAALRQAGVSGVDRVVLSHADADHAGGAEGLLAAMPVRDVLGEPMSATVAARRCVRGESWTWDGVDFHILHPPDGLVASRNDASCVLRIAAAGRVFLLTGDIGLRAEHLLQAGDSGLLRADVLLVPHHGSRSSSGAALVRTVAPRIALVSAGHRNRFGHPHPQVIARYQDAGTRILETARHGAVRLRVEADGSLALPECWRTRHRRFWFIHDAAAARACGHSEELQP